MSVVDWHTNLWLPEHFSKGESAFTEKVAKTSDASPEAFENLVVPEVDYFIVVTMNFPRMGISVPNEFVANFVRRFENRARGFACIDPCSDTAVEDLEHAILHLGLHGLKISPVYGGFDPWSKIPMEVYKTCARLDVPLLWHQSAGYPKLSALEYGNPILLDRIARKFPNLKMIVAHLGQPWMEETIVLMRKHPQIFSDLSARFHRKWQLYNGLMTALEYGVADQLLFGSDFPVRTPEKAAKEFRSINDWGPDVSMPKIPTKVIESIINNRPLQLIWPDN